MKNDNSYSWTSYSNQIINAVMPWIAFACLAFVILVLAIVIRCLKSMCCKQKIKERGDLIKNVCISISFIITLLSLTCCALIIYYSDTAYQSYQQLQCSSGRIPYALLKGSNGYH